MFASKFAHWLQSFNGSQRPGDRIDLVEMEGVARDCMDAQNLVREMSRAGFRLHAEKLESCWALSLPKTWTELEAKFSKKHRRKTKKAWQRLCDPKIEVASIGEIGFEAVWAKLCSLASAQAKCGGRRWMFRPAEFLSRFSNKLCGNWRVASWQRFCKSPAIQNRSRQHCCSETTPLPSCTKQGSILLFRPWSPDIY